jgi:hypothetical protein
MWPYVTNKTRDFAKLQTWRAQSKKFHGIVASAWFEQIMRVFQNKNPDMSDKNCMELIDA